MFQRRESIRAPGRPRESAACGPVVRPPLRGLSGPQATPATQVTAEPRPGSRRPARRRPGPGLRTGAALGALALTLQLRALDSVPVSTRMADTLATAGAIARGAAAPLQGPAVWRGAAHPALLPWLLSIPAALSRDPRLALGMLAVLNVAGLLGLYALVRRYHSGRAALLAAAVWLVNPWNAWWVRTADPAALLRSWPAAPIAAGSSPGSTGARSSSSSGSSS